MKKVILILAPFIALSAYADTLITKTDSAGTVVLVAQTTRTCTIEATDVTVKVTGPAIAFPTTQQRTLQFTRDVPNVDVARSLIVEASRGTLTHLIGPIGGAHSSYVATVPGQNSSTAVLLMTSGGMTVSQNQSKAATKLVAFTNKNCK